MSASLAAAAFGDDPGRWPLPAERAPRALWLRAVAAGGQGRYATARADLLQLLTDEAAGRYRALALSCHASFLRQLGWHWHAHNWDGRAWAEAAGDPEAGADALIGLAADALGVGRLAVSGALLTRAAELASRAEPPRMAIRLEWVRAELAMAGGDGAAAVYHARRAVELAAEATGGLRRHRVKSDVVLAAALCTSGDVAASRVVADAALIDSSRHGLVPLQWAIACLLSDLGSESHGPADIAAIRDRSAQWITRHGGHLKMG